MIVKPELISASSAPSARPLNNWEMKLGQLIMKTIGVPIHKAKSLERDSEKVGAAGRT
jgi:hypothetical protein